MTIFRCELALLIAVVALTGCQRKEDDWLVNVANQTANDMEPQALSEYNATQIDQEANFINSVRQADALMSQAGAEIERRRLRQEELEQAHRQNQLDEIEQRLKRIEARQLTEGR